MRIKKETGGKNKDKCNEYKIITKKVMCLLIIKRKLKQINFRKKKQISEQEILSEVRRGIL